MFRINSVKNEQVNLFSKTDNWTNYQQKIINESWVGYFHDIIFPAINEEPYRTLYSDNDASCPNTPVNILVSLLIIKKLSNLTDEEVIESLLFDQRTQYAVHTLDSDKQPISKNMIGNFRRKIVNHETRTGINLFDNTMNEINNLLIKIHDVDRSIERIDSMMISSSCKKLSRVELVYTVNCNFVKLLKKFDKVPSEYECYLNEKHRNEVIYRTRDSETDDKLTTLLSTSLKLYETFKDDKDVCESQEFKLLDRMINDQYDKDNNKPKDNKDIKPNSLQTPVDPEATFRQKYTGNIGYVGNIVEANNNGNPMITDWSVDCNTKSDTEFMKEYLEKEENHTNNVETINDDSNQKEIKNIKVVDGAYYSDEIRQLGEKKGIEIHPTELVGKKVDNKNLLEFNIDNKSYQVLECQNNVKPISSTYNEENHTIRANFNKEICNGCPYKDKCAILTSPKNSNTFVTTVEKLNNAEQKAKMNDTEYQKLSNTRAAIEGVPSVMRRRYHIDDRANKGKVYLKMDFSASMLSINIKRASKMAGSMLNNVTFLINSLFKKFFHKKKFHFIFFSIKLKKRGGEFLNF